MIQALSIGEVYTLSPAGTAVNTGVINGMVPLLIRVATDAAINLTMMQADEGGTLNPADDATAADTPMFADSAEYFELPANNALSVFGTANVIVTVMPKGPKGIQPSGY